MSRCLLVALGNGEWLCVNGMNESWFSLGSPPTLSPPLTSDEVRIYHDRHLSWTHSLSSPITDMWFGRYGSEDNTLILVSKSGALEIKV